MKKQTPEKVSSIVDVYDPYSSPGRSLPRTPRSGARKKGGGKKFKFVSTRMGIRRSSSRRRHRSSSRRRNSLSRRSSGIHGIDSNETTTESRRRRQASDGGNVFSPTKDGLPTFLQKKIPPSIRRTKSSKLSQGKENRPLMDMTSLMAQGSNLRNTEVELPFFMPAIESPDAIDLSNCATQFQDATVRPLHHSILGKDHCFEVVNKETRCFGCDSAGEREAWIEKIKRAINPNLDNSRRVEHQLILFVQEAKGLPTKKKYFCEICLDRKLCARTTSKWKNDSSIFWGEHFEFTSMPKIEDVTVHLYKDSDKKKKKDKDYIGLVNLPVRTLINQQSVEKWYTLSTPSGNNKSKAGESMALRIKARFLSTRVLPSDQYKEFAEHISKNYMDICRTLGNVISVTRKDEIARILVNIMQCTGCIKEYMTEIVMEEVEKVEEESLIFRENTIGTKSVEAMLRLVGMKYLYDTLGDFIHALFNMEEDCEVDGSRLPPHASLEANQNNLHMSCEIALCKIVSSVSIFPSELREVMASWRVRCEDAGRPRIANRLVTASLFLRLLCPSILNPSLFGLANEVPDPKISRTLTLIAKVIQNLANRSRFGNKEEYMQFMDVFVREKWDDMGAFISNVSDPSLPPLSKGFHGFIDLGKEFAKLHAFFIEVIPTLDQKTVDNLGDLPFILSKVTEALEKPSHAYATPPQRRVSTEPLNLTQIVEDVPLSHESDPLHPGCSSTPMLGRSFLPSGASSSLLELRDFINAAEDGHYDVPCTNVVNGFSPTHHGSHPSLPITCSYNNSNNATTHWSRQTLSSTENLMTSTTSSGKQTHLTERPPLMFSNPAYQLQKHSNRGSTPASLSAMHDALNLHPHDVADDRMKKSSQGIPPASSAPSLNESKNQAPLSFANPLQAMGGAQQRHLETVFTTETVTYSAPSRYIFGSSPGPGSQSSQAFAGLRGSQSGNVFQTNSMSSNGSQSNDSSLSSRQSSTTTATNSNANNSSSDIAEQSQQAGRANLHYRRQQNEQSRVTPNSTASKSRGTRSIGSEHEAADDDQLLMSVETVSTSVSNAHLKTGLQSHNQPQRGHKKPDEQFKPQPKPRSSLGHFAREDSMAGRKVSVPNLSARNVTPNLTPRRGSADNVKPLHLADDPLSKYPSFHLSKLDQDAILELNEATDTDHPIPDHRQHRHKESSMTSSKDQDGFVHAPVAAVKSRVVVATSNANRVKTSKHGSATSSQHKPHPNPTSGQPGRRSSYQKTSSSPKHSSQPAPPPPPAALPPTTPEGQLSPEARTAQWILNNVPTPNKEMKHDEMEVVLTPKDYEDRIIRLETEVERLRARLSDGIEIQRNMEHQEAVMLEKVRNSEKRESRAYEKFRKQTDEKDQQMHKVLQRLSAIELDHKRERVELQAMIDSKECMVTEQQKRIRKLEHKLQRAYNHPTTQDAPPQSGSQLQHHRQMGADGGLSFIDDDVDPDSSLVRGKKNHLKTSKVVAPSSSSQNKPSDPYCNGQFYLQGLSSGSVSSSSSI